MAFEITDSFDFPEDRPELRKFDASMRCGICKEIFTAPVSLRCGHCFCSECLRNHLVYASQHHFDVCCPDCRREFCEGDIQSLVTFNTAVGLYKDIRRSLLDGFLYSPGLAQSPEGPSLDSASLASMGQCREDLMVPPKLHMNSTNVSQLKKRLGSFSIPTEGNKQALASRYRAFRTFVQVEKEKGNMRSMDEVAKAFRKQEKDRKFNNPSMKLDVFCKTKTHLDLVKEIRDREASRVPSRAD